MNVLVLGGAGELGSHFASLCVSLGHSVRIIDITRFYEAWRLKELGIQDKVEYVWKASFDVNADDCIGADLILDAVAQADRPMGNTSPKYTLLENLLSPLSLLEVVRYFHVKPFIIYPSSSVEFLGVPKEQQPIVESSIPKPTNLYGFTKWAAEELYMTHRRAFKIPCMIIRTGSCYGPMMRTDQFIAQCIIKCLKNEDIVVKSPKATRTYTFTEDVMEFYKLFLKKFEEDPESFDGIIISNGGNSEDKPYETIEAAQIIKTLTGSSSAIIPGEYEVGELITGKPVYQWEKSELAYELLGWKPMHTFEEGLKKTIEWFKGRYA
ncbi:MAG: NAD(P)-dependent oxidoreductase [Candidatus Bathyarchaeota archaeon]|nr:NAD(P)-dependent oxidoreductase [Candidatus Bathyarchaeota archaeon]